MDIEMQNTINDCNIFIEVLRRSRFPKSSLEPFARMPMQGPSSRLGNSMDSLRAFPMSKWVSMMV
jgi:hypothetical protein